MVADEDLVLLVVGNHQDDLDVAVLLDVRLLVVRRKLVLASHVDVKAQSPRRVVNVDRDPAGLFDYLKNPPADRKLKTKRLKI